MKDPAFFAMGDINHRVLLFLFTSLSFGLLLLFSNYSQAFAVNPGDYYVFPGESSVYSTGNSQYEPTISGNIVLWADTEAHRSRIFFKDLSKGPGEPGHPLIDGEIHSKFPEINRDGNLVVWMEMIGAGQQIYYKNVNFTGDYMGCTGNLQQCGASALYGGQYWQENPAVSPDGSKIAWEYGRSHGSQIYLHDFNTGSDQEVYGMPGGDQEYPSLDNDWLVWTDGRNLGTSGDPRKSAIFVKQLSSSEPARPIATNNSTTNTNDYLSGDINSNASVSEGKICRNNEDQPVVVYISTSNDRFGRVTYVIHSYNLATNLDVEVTRKQGRITNPSIDGDKVVWLDCSENTRCEVFLYDLTTQVQQKVTQDSSLGANAPAICASSNYIVWKAPWTSPAATIYYNRVGDTAQLLANKYKPILKLASGENFDPVQVEQMLTAYGTNLSRQNSNGYLSKFNPTPYDLTHYCNTPDCFINLNGDAVEAGGGDYSCSIDRGYIFSNYVQPYWKGRKNYPSVVYSHVVRVGSETVIEYWLGYYANDYPEVFHEGDWEHIDVILDGTLSPKKISYSQHTGVQWRNWPKEDMDANPVVYVGLGSHANYFTAGEHSFAPSEWDLAWGNGRSVTPDVIVIPEKDQATDTSFDWLNFVGRWGEYTGANLCARTGFMGDQRDGPVGPGFQGTWPDPINGLNDSNCDGCQDKEGAGTDVEVTKHSPVDIHIYDSQGRHVGKNADGGFDKQIPGSEYLDYPDLDRASIIIHGADISAGYRIEADGNGTGPCGLTITAPDHAVGLVDTLNYQSIQVNPTTKITANLDPSKNYAISIDANGDGTSVTQKTPDTTTTKSVDFTPPAQVTDFIIAGADSGSATLSFTAPGDDASQGTATAYDLRYSDSAISDQYWNDSVPADTPPPLPSGSMETLSIVGLEQGKTYIFAIKALDDVNLSSPLSNVASVRIPIVKTTASTPSAAASGYNSIDISIPYGGDENTDGSVLIEYKLSGDASWTEYGSISHPKTSATISELAYNSTYDIRTTYQDPDGVEGTAVSEITTIPLPHDDLAPSVAYTGPDNLNTSIATFTANYDDSELSSGIKLDSAMITLDGSSYIPCSASEGTISCTVTGIATGWYESGMIYISDNAGNIGAASIWLNVDLVRYIGSDTEGGDCASVDGEWDSETRTCTLTRDLTGTERLEIGGDNMTLDGAGHSLAGGALTGVTILARNNVTVKNLNVGGYWMAGIHVESSSGVTLLDNTVDSNGYYGICINNSSQMTLERNSMSANRYNFYLGGNQDTHFSNEIDTSNTVGGKSIYFVKNAANEIYGPASDAGTFYCISCNNVTIQDLTLSGNGNGVYLRNTTNSHVENVTATDNLRGIFLQDSNGNTITRSDISSSGWNGIALTTSNNNAISSNTSSNLPGVGIYALYSNGNTISDNYVSSSWHAGIWLSNNCAFNTLTGNTMQANTEGLVLYLAPNNTIYANNFIDNGLQIRVFRHNTTHSTTYNGQTETHIVYVELNNAFALPPPMGGNYWSNYRTPAQGCHDNNADGFCDATFSFPGGQDGLPLVYER